MFTKNGLFCAEVFAADKLWGKAGNETAAQVSCIFLEKQIIPGSPYLYAAIVFEKDHADPYCLRMTSAQWMSCLHQGLHTCSTMCKSLIHVIYTLRKQNIKIAPIRPTCVASYATPFKCMNVRHQQAHQKQVKAGMIHHHTVFLPLKYNIGLGLRDLQYFSKVMWEVPQRKTRTFWRKVE